MDNFLKQKRKPLLDFIHKKKEKKKKNSPPTQIYGSDEILSSENLFRYFLFVRYMSYIGAFLEMEAIFMTTPNLYFPVY